MKRLINQANQILLIQTMVMSIMTQQKNNQYVCSSTDEDCYFSERQEVYLCLDGTPVFKVTFSKSNLQQTVHGQPVSLSEGRFFIVRLMKGCSR